MPRVVRLAATVVVLAVVLAGCHPKTPPPAQPEPTVAERLAAARTALAAGDCARARPELAEAVRLAPGSAEAQLLLGICAFKLQDPKAGQAALSRAMPSIKTIVCAVDFSDGSPEVAAYAAALATAAGATILCLYVAPSLAEYVGFSVPQASLDHERLPFFAKMMETIS